MTTPTPTPRRVPLDFDRQCPPDWYGSSLAGSTLLDVYSLVFPALEKLMIRQMSAVAQKVAPVVGDETLRAFMQQEGAHAREHRRSLECVRAQGFHIDRVQRVIDGLVFGGLELLLRRVLVPVFGDAFAVGIFAGAEHWTAGMSEMALSPGALPITLTSTTWPDGLREMPEMEALFLWHCCEELEHKSVVADAFRALRGSEATRIITFAMATSVLFLVTITTHFALLAQLPRVLGRQDWRQRGGWRGLWRDASTNYRKLPWHYWQICRAYCTPGFDPRDHDTEPLLAASLERLDRARQVFVRSTASLASGETIR